MKGVNPLRSRDLQILRPISRTRSPTRTYDAHSILVRHHRAFYLLASEHDRQGYTSESSVARSGVQIALAYNGRDGILQVRESRLSSVDLLKRITRRVPDKTQSTLHFCKRTGLCDLKNAGDGQGTESWAWVRTPRGD
jgi:hypothetical protein